MLIYYSLYFNHSLYTFSIFGTDSRPMFSHFVISKNLDLTIFLICSNLLSKLAIKTAYTEKQIILSESKSKEFLALYISVSYTSIISS